MSQSSGQYQGSQAFSHIVPDKNESINLNTGSLNFKYDIINLRGILSSVNLDISLNYSEGMTGTFGLPTNWGLNLPYVTDGKTVTFGGRTYIIDPYWSDMNGYMSGLRYLNNQGVKFSVITPAQPLPSSKPGYYNFTLRQADGSTDYFDGLGRPVLHEDIFGNSIYYRYIDPVTRVTDPQPCLDRIVDSWGQVVDFGYYMPGNGMIVSGPDGAKTTINYSADGGVSLIQDAEDNKTALQYIQVAESNKCISEIIYATGLSSRFAYTTLPYQNTVGQLAYMPAVSSHQHVSAAGKLLKQTNYGYGALSGGNTYTGYNAGYSMGGLTDNLMDSGNQSFSYDMTVTDVDVSGNIITATATWFNYLHLPVLVIRYCGDGDERAPVYQTVYTYSIEGEKHARTPNYALPRITEFMNNTTPSQQHDPNWRGLRRVTAEYNSYCQLTYQLEEMMDGQGPSAAYKKMKEAEKTYFTTKYGTQLVIKEKDTDLIDNSMRIMQSEKSADEKTIASSKMFFRPASQTAGTEADARDWKTVTMAYDKQGRVTEVTNAWTKDAPGNGSLTDYTTSTSYGFSDGIFTQSINDSSMAKDKYRVSCYDMRIAGGPIVSQALPGDQAKQKRETFAYDKLGRVVSFTDLLDRTTTTAYSVGPTINAETATSPWGYVYRKVSDELGRVIQELDNSDPSSEKAESEGSWEASTPTRVLKSTTYDVAGRAASTTDMLGLVTVYVVDALGREVQVTDPLGNIATTSYDDVQLEVRNYLNGAQVSSTILDAGGRTVSQTAFPSSAASTGTQYCLIEDTFYNGFGQKTSGTTSWKPVTGGNKTKFKSTSLAYNADGKVMTSVSSGTGDGDDAGSDEVTRSFSYDVAGNRSTWHKTTKYANNSKTFEVDGPVTIFDMHGRLTTLRDQLGREETNSYNDDGWLTSTKRIDGTIITYDYDLLGRPTSIKTNKSNLDVTMAYNARGDKIYVNYNGKKTLSSYYKDGSLASVRYGDQERDPVQKYTRDRFSRLVDETDVFGTHKTSTYDSFGRPASITSKGDTVTYQYGQANDRKGALIGKQLTVDEKVNPQSQGYQQVISYDGFNARSRVTTERPDQSLVLETVYEMGPRRQLRSVKSSAPLRPELNQTHTWAYDGIGQLTREEVSATGGTGKTEEHSLVTFVYDGNSNILLSTMEATSADGVKTSKQMVMTYNKLDQRTDDTRFVYDDNGRLLSDSTGARYAFDEQDRLLSVQTPDGIQGQLEYHGDSSVAAIVRPAAQTRFFYHSDANVTAVSHQVAGQAAQESSLLRVGQRVIASHPASSSSSASSEVSSEAPVYFFERNGSTALQLSGESDATALKYEAYGSCASSAPVSPQTSFTYGQELSDPSSGLVYLRSRFYQPGAKTFICQDSYLVENRYAYCQGDPVNYADPSGHQEEGSHVAIVAGIVGVIFATIASAGIMGVMAGGSVLFASAVASVVGNVTFSMTSRFVHLAMTKEWQPYGFTDVLVDVVGGALGGMLSVGAGQITTRAFGALKRMPWLVTHAETIGDTLGGVADGLFQLGIAEGRYLKNGTEDPMKPSLGAEFATGMLAGLVVGKLGKYFSRFSNRRAMIASRERLWNEARMNSRHSPSADWVAAQARIRRNQGYATESRILGESPQQGSPVQSANNSVLVERVSAGGRSPRGGYDLNESHFRLIEMVNLPGQVD